MDKKHRHKIFEKFQHGPVIGDGGFMRALEKRGYVRAGPWTPECVVKHPDAVKQLHREFLRSGSDVMQAYTFWATQNKFDHASNNLGIENKVDSIELNKKACRIARDVANEGNAIVAVSLTQIPAYKEGMGKEFVQSEFRSQVDVFKQCDIDLIICELFGDIEELEWAVEVAKEANKPIATTMCIGTCGDDSGVSTGECAVRMARAGADIIGVNCQFDPYQCLEAMQLMKTSLQEHNLKPYLMVQPLGYLVPEMKGTNKMSLLLPESPFAMEVRSITRFEAAKWARDCYKLGIDYIGGCCGFEPHHIRAISEELEEERGIMCEITKDIGHIAEGLMGSDKLYQQERATADYWKQLEPCCGRPNTLHAQLVEDI